MLWGYTIAIVCVGIVDLLVDVAFSDLAIIGVSRTVKKPVMCLPSVEEDLPSSGDDTNRPSLAIVVGREI